MSKKLVLTGDWEFSDNYPYTVTLCFKSGVEIKKVFSNEDQLKDYICSLNADEVQALKATKTMSAIIDCIKDNNSDTCKDEYNEYIVEIKSKDDTFVSQEDIFDTEDKAKDYALSHLSDLGDGEYFQIISPIYDDEENEIDVEFIDEVRKEEE